jgi:hypothetical protein
VALNSGGNKKRKERRKEEEKKLGLSCAKLSRSWG